MSGELERAFHEWCEKHLNQQVLNGEHLFILTAESDHRLGRCQGPCRLIVTRQEAFHRKFGPCVAGAAA